jgi:hypothetical protein
VTDNEGAKMETHYCPACMGAGEHDFRDDNAIMREHYTDGQIARMEEMGLVIDVEIVQCDECEGTGIVTMARYLDLRAYAVAQVDQVLARVLAEESASPSSR